MNKNEYICNEIIEKLKDGYLYQIDSRCGKISYFNVSGNFYETFYNEETRFKNLVSESIVRLAIKRALLWNFDAYLKAI